MHDCWRQCIARLVGIDIELVPDFVAESELYWLDSTSAWLADRGLRIVAMAAIRTGTEAGTPMDVANICQPRPPYIAVGATEAWESHAVVFDADGSLWEPAEGGTGLLAVYALYWVLSG